MPVEIKDVSDTDICTLVTIHNQAFPGFFLTSLGSAFLSLYYRTVKKSSKGILLGYYREGRLLGFCAATMKSASFHSQLIKENLFAYILMAFRLLLTNPGAIVHLYKNLAKRGGVFDDAGEYAELLSIGVDIDYQRSGIGKALLCELEQVIVGKGGKVISLTTDYDDNAKAQGFYSSLGYRVYYDFIAYHQRKMYRYIKNMNK